MLSGKLNDAQLKEMEIRLYYQAASMPKHNELHEAVPRITRFEYGVQRRPWYQRLSYGGTKKRMQMIDTILSAPLRLSSVIAASRYELIDKCPSDPKEWRRCSSFVKKTSSSSSSSSTNIELRDMVHRFFDDDRRDCDNSSQHSSSRWTKALNFFKQKMHYPSALSLHMAPTALKINERLCDYTQASAFVLYCQRCKELQKKTIIPGEARTHGH
jgi:hypothetical protein